MQNAAAKVNFNLHNTRLYPALESKWRVIYNEWAQALTELGGHPTPTKFHVYLIEQATKDVELPPTDN